MLFLPFPECPLGGTVLLLSLHETTLILALLLNLILDSEEE